MGYRVQIFGQSRLKKPEFQIFTAVPVLKHTRGHYGEGLRKFPAKTNVKIRSYKSKTSKILDFWPKWPFLTVFDQKRAKNEFFSKIRLEHFFTLPKPYLTAKYQ